MKHRLLILMFALIGLVTGGIAIMGYVSKERSEGEFEVLRESIFQENLHGGELETEQKIETQSGNNESQNPVLIAESYAIPAGLRELMTENRSVVGWLTIAGSRIDYPVVQNREDNEYFLHRDISGNNSYPGSIYLDSNHDMNSFGLHVLYGHNMKNGTMFHDITRFMDSQYMEEHSDIDVYLNDRKLELEPVYCYADEADGSYRGRYDTPDELCAFLKEKTGLDITGNIFVLITCSYNGENERTYLICRERGF